MIMTEMHLYYLLSWGSACLVSVVLMIRGHKNVELFHRDYWKAQAQGGKIMAFLIAATLLTVIAPYTEKPEKPEKPGQRALRTLRVH